MVLGITATTACTTPNPPPQRGLALPTLASAGYEAASVIPDLRGIVDIGAQWVQINPTWYQSDDHGSDIARGPATASDAGVERVIAAAHDMGLKVFLKPHLDVLDGTYRGSIRPADRNAWYADYTQFISFYAAEAARTGVEMFAVGTELAGTSDDRERWLAVISEVRRHYSGPVTYAANFDEYQAVGFWDALDLIGIDAYWPLTATPTTDAATLENAWKPIRSTLADFARNNRRRVIFTEAGYTSQRGTTTKPWSWTVSRQPDQAEQAAGYRALLASFGDQRWWAGVYWWYWARPMDPHPFDPLDYSLRGKQAEQVLRKAWEEQPEQGK